ncbi:MAG TPA: Fur family transcriptional regulator [Solirubrobacteraceae bacterium]
MRRLTFGLLPMPPVTDTLPDLSPELTELLHSRGQRATPQRYVILRELRRRRRHATADEIGRAVRAELPGTSTPTVYATLELFVELGLARRIGTGLGAALYDARTEPHQHTICRHCGRVDDVDGELDTSSLFRTATRAGFRPEGAELVICGLCADCAAASGS